MQKQSRLLFLLGLILISLHTNLKAQSDWLDGFIIELDGDTVKGKVGYQTSDLQFSKCIFKQENSVREYSPEQIMGYGIKDIKSYVSGIIESGFTEVVATGPLSLYKQRKTLFVRTESGEVYSLASKVKTTRKDGDDYVSETQKWRGVLNGILISCGPDPEELKSISFNVKSILEQIVKYNNCKGSSTKVHLKDKFVSKIIDFGLLVGRRSSELDISSANGSVRPTDAILKSSNIVFGGLVDFRYPNFSDHISLQLGANFQQVSLSGLSKIHGNFLSPNATKYETNIEYTMIGIPVSVKAVLIDKKVSAFFQFGLVYNQLINSSSKLTTSRFTNGTQTITETDDILKIRSNDVHIFWRVGLLKSIKGKYKIGFTLDFLLPNNNLILNAERFSPFKQKGISLFILY